jgi:hypothetical protein
VGRRLGPFRRGMRYGVWTAVAVTALAACGGGSGHASSVSAPHQERFVGRFPAGVATLSWNRDGTTLTAAMDVAETTPSSPLALVRVHVAVRGSIHGSDVTLDPGGGADPWSGTIDGAALTLTWTPSTTGAVTTIFTAGTTADFAADVQSYGKDVAAAQQAAAASTAEQAQKQAAADAAAQARQQAHDAQVAAMRAAHDAKVAAQRQRYETAAAHAAAERAAQAKAAAHHP